MLWVVDTCLLLDIGLDDPLFARMSEDLLADKAEDGLVVCPVTFVELAPAFRGQHKYLEEFLSNLGIEYREDWTWEDTAGAHLAWSRHVERRRSGHGSKRPVADVLIGAFATRHRGLLTRNGRDFSTAFPRLEIVEP